METFNNVVTTAVQDYRAANRISQVEIAEIVGLSQSAMSYRLAGRTTWTVNELEKLAAAWPDFECVLPTEGRPRAGEGETA